MKRARNTVARVRMTGCLVVRVSVPHFLVGLRPEVNWYPCRGSSGNSRAVRTWRT